MATSQVAPSLTSWHFQRSIEHARQIFETAALVNQEAMKYRMQGIPVEQFEACYYQELNYLDCAAKMLHQFRELINQIQDYK